MEKLKFTPKYVKELLLESLVNIYHALLQSEIDDIPQKE